MRKILSLLLVLTISILIVLIGVSGEPLNTVSFEQTIAPSAVAVINLDNIVEGVILPDIVVETFVIVNAVNNLNFAVPESGTIETLYDCITENVILTANLYTNKEVKVAIGLDAEIDNLFNSDFTNLYTKKWGKVAVGLVTTNR